MRSRHVARIFLRGGGGTGHAHQTRVGQIRVTHIGMPIHKLSLLLFLVQNGVRSRRAHRIFGRGTTCELGPHAEGPPPPKKDTLRPTWIYSVALKLQLLSTHGETIISVPALLKKKNVLRWYVLFKYDSKSVNIINFT